MSELSATNARAVPAQIEPVLIDAISAAKLLSISTKTLWLRTKSGEIPAKKIGGRVLYSLQKLREFANSTDSETP